MSIIFHYCNKQHRASKYKLGFTKLSKFGYCVLVIDHGELLNLTYSHAHFSYEPRNSEIQYLDKCKTCKHGLRMILGVCKVELKYEQTNL